MKQRNLSFFEQRHALAVGSVDPDSGNGELLIKITQELWPYVSELRPLRVIVEFALQQPEAGLYFVVPEAEDHLEGAGLAERGAHAFTAVYENSSRLWFPCVDSYSEPCTWKLEITVEDDMVAIASGELLDIIYTQVGRNECR